MLRSMTGFGRATVGNESLNVTVEIKSVNHRYFEFSARMPRAYQFLEEKLKAFCQKQISRGKIELSVFVEELTDNSTEVVVNHTYAKAFIKALKNLSKEYKIKNDLKVSSLVNNSEIFKLRKNALPDEVVEEVVLEALGEAVNAFIAMRETEGARLKNDVLSRANTILSKVALVEEHSPETVKAYRERLEAKIKELLENAQVDEQRLITETAIFADKVAVDEETVRLRSHIKQLETLLESAEPIGKKLDFIVQEMNRETNTIGSKSQNIEIAHIVVDIKSEIEKIREQIQNIE
ncbi:MAG: YicC family protein [Clostridia bacterium]|nr:YicC family protein [Clostridia bacterium]MBR4973789.1 YicC family protein [Clostridia bacterium]